MGSEIRNLYLVPQNLVQNVLRNLMIRNNKKANMRHEIITELMPVTFCLLMGGLGTRLSFFYQSIHIGINCSISGKMNVSPAELRDLKIRHAHIIRYYHQFQIWLPHLQQHTHYPVPGALPPGLKPLGHEVDH
jgi:hypothetical protein